MNAANYFLKTQPQIAAKWSTKTLWEQLSRVKKAVGEACSKVTGNGIAGKSSEQLATTGCKLSPACKPSFLRGFVKRKGVSRFEQQIQRIRTNWSRGGNRFFGRDYIWRRMRTGHLIGFAALFLASEEREAQYAAFERRLELYETVFDNVKDMFTQKDNDCGTSIDGQFLGSSLSDYKLGKCIETGCNGAVYEAEAVTNDISEDGTLPSISHHQSGRCQQVKAKLAIKMIFNFNSSHAGDVWRDTRAEMVTCGRGAMTGLKDWQNGSRPRMKKLPFHPNVIQIKKAMFHKVPECEEFIAQHPAALPHPKGFGRSTAMFLVMKRYKSTLKEILEKGNMSLTTRYILALQLLNGVAHLESNKVAHRDLKSDNILIDMDANGIPRLTIADFGCAYIAEPGKDLILSEKFDLRNGAGCVQPPEIRKCVANPNYILDYRKSDAWAAGLLLCEIFRIKRNRIDESIPDRNSEKTFIMHLIKMLLEKSTSSRISCSDASKVLHLHLFGPKFSQNEVDIEAAVSQWVLMHAAETIAYKSTNWGMDSVVCELFTNFLSAISLSTVCSPLMLWCSLYKKC